ncbi:predicted protein [Nematostella vectensis]|uniref:Uncharacterized protein n=1 Tax=Nematostella vectensis TaxID=45351 RepID=A7SHL4_NEMVE|nr:calponin homology domain-containing protein DDB_G0272472 [Nematostella vectensis]EDO36799.1 predicted protein [Nematostella vectensis]|eukprot:XP_001628862.1 predicted protein [Nematostella vectensis]
MFYPGNRLRRKGSIIPQSPPQQPPSTHYLTLPKLTVGGGDELSDTTNSMTTYDATTTGTLSPDLMEEVNKALFDLNMSDQEAILEEQMGSNGELESKQPNATLKPVGLSDEEERNIQRQVHESLVTEYQKIYAEANRKQKKIRKTFRHFIEEARTALIASRIEAERASINRLAQNAEVQQAVILQQRIERKNTERCEFGATCNECDVSRGHAEEVAILRKIRADLDRARARRMHSLRADVKKRKNKTKVVNLLHFEIRKLERAHEVHNLILELHSLGLQEVAQSLTHALSSKETAEQELRDILKREKDEAKARAVKRKNEEVTRLRNERLEEKRQEALRKLELERIQKEQEEKAKREQVYEALRRKARNQERRKWMEMSLMGLRTSRSFTFSYFKPVAPNTPRDKK